MRYIVLFILLSVTQEVLSEGAPDEFFAQIVDVTSDGEVSVEITNTSTEKQWLHKAMRCNDAGYATTQLFEVLQGLELVEYAWVEESDANFFSRDNYIELAPQDKVKFSCKLAVMYSMKQNRSYTVRYRAMNPKFFNKREKILVETQIERVDYQK